MQIKKLLLIAFKDLRLIFRDPSALVLMLLAYFIDVPSQFESDSIFFGWNSVILGITCLLQFFVSLVIDSKYEKGLSRYSYWMIWYPLIYWILNVITTVIAVPKAIFKRKGKRGVWASPDRGLKEWVH